MAINIKTHRILSTIVLVISMSLLVFANANIAGINVTNASAHEDAVAITNIGDEIRYEEGRLGEGDIRGPESFSIKPGGGFYLLDTASRHIISFDLSGKANKLYTYGDLDAVKIAAGMDNNLYVIDVSRNIIGKIDNRGKITTYRINNINTECIIDFGVEHTGRPYMTLVDHLGAITYILELSNGSAVAVEKKCGRLLPDGKVYKTTLIGESNHTVGHKAKVEVWNKTGEIERNLLVESRYWLEGVSYLGDINGFAIIRTHESASYGNGVTVFENIIKKIDINGNVMAQYVLPKKYKYIQNDTCINGNMILHLSTQKDSVSLLKIQLDSPRTVISTLENAKGHSSVENVKYKNVITSTLDTVARSLIQQTVESYWKCTWHCSGSNYKNADPSWRRPRYIISAGCDYQCIPYCWGGWDTYDGFLDRISKGITAGNIGDVSLPSSTCGVDCSGYVQRCWGINDAKRNTTMLDSSNISYAIDASSLKYGDAWNKSGHILIYEKTSGYGDYVTYESTTSNSYDRVSHMTRSISSVQSNYHSIRRHNINEDV